MIEAVHFIYKRPENKNISLTNKKDNLIKILIINGFTDEKKKPKTLVDGKYMILDFFENKLRIVMLNHRTQEQSQTEADQMKFRISLRKDKELVEKLFRM